MGLDQELRPMSKPLAPDRLSSTKMEEGKTISTDQDNF